MEAPAALAAPVKAGRVGDAVHDLPESLQRALTPVTEPARVSIQRLRTVGPSEIEVEFGVDLAVEAGAIITKSTANCLLKITVVGKRGDAQPPGEDQASD
ncbi:CU044_2847 family protein [Actinacidiphila paucisporea]|uniref:Trypsin-co-occurring domain-containing protein n=1 Tax=Actinacidiphila paucisporea TaxID=310782 RepID=A0A1M7MFR7_9ACTN|nr:CU044_2847 family protein [Actinacidiphila paucisporea]SHM89637.1 hypothetical protein SAMN05216499_11622 [Actinacidiphila paucisporea]